MVDTYWDSPSQNKDFVRGGVFGYCIRRDDFGINACTKVVYGYNIIDLHTSKAN
jgi:hypothetical protein